LRTFSTLKILNPHQIPEFSNEPKTCPLHDNALDARVRHANKVPQLRSHVPHPIKSTFVNFAHRTPPFFLKKGVWFGL